MKKEAPHAIDAAWTCSSQKILEANDLDLRRLGLGDRRSTLAVDRVHLFL